MRKRVLLTVLFIIIGVIAALIMALLWSPEPRDYLTVVVATIAVLALVQNWLSSSAATANLDIAKINEERKKYGWSIVLHPDGGSYVLRNTGTLTARDVKLGVQGDRARAAFLQHEGDVGPVIPYNQSKGFRADFPWTSRGTEIQIEWLPDGENTRRIHTEVIQPTPDRIAEYEANQRKKLDDQYAASEAASQRYAAECRRLLIDLSDAWATYLAEPSTSNKVRVQGIVGALPTNFAREIGYAVDVPRDFWGVHQWPFEGWFPNDPENQELVRENSAIIELIWNLRDVQIPRFVEPDRSQQPDPWPRIERAVYGFKDLVRQREAGEREPRNGQRDRDHRREVDQIFADRRRGEGVEGDQS